MSAETGTIIIAPVVPPDSVNTYPTHYDYYGHGGHRSVATVLDRDAIPTDRRAAGMLVTVVSTETIYLLAADLLTWEKVAGVSPDGSLTLEFNVGFSNPTAQVTSIAGGKEVIRVAVAVTVPWNGIGASLSVGTSPGGGQILPSDQLELTGVAVFEEEVFDVSGPTPVYLSVVPGVVASQGSCVVRLTVA